ncbi:hypothetical protein K458DRAFT_301161 [Lentithecium fluviatile CBS 122367]|uniref:CHRD domain-containing protein n=1 Tax=Lentithecium fluviatile CBS 122367 TaxID=1168545 RepID=A0A6G1J4H7_9PLEO|nr:hypothetical protein K458DRAFT_301161 [Lentithecium fluviatile CBS 122367]
MQFSTAALTALLATSAVASPTWGHGGDKKNHWLDKWDKNDYKHEKVFYFDKTIIVKAEPDQVRNGTTPVPGQPSAKGLFKFGINVEENTICYNITLSGVTGDYQSPALTATHIHEAARGTSGPPRLAFPNPKGPDDRRVSYGCLTGPFKTGVPGPDGADTGANFHVEQIVANPAGFFCDSHTKQFPLGAVRGQLA